MKNKTKLWRRNAVRANRAVGMKHQGRRWKHLSYVNLGKLAIYPLLQSIMQSGGFMKTSVAEVETETN
jgi:hypothetical protein